MKSTNINIYNYPIKKLIPVLILFIIFIIGLFFCLDFFANSALPNNNQIFESEYNNKNLLVTYILFPICILALIACCFYIYQYSSSLEERSNKLVKRRMLASDILLDIDNIRSIDLTRFIFLLFIKDKNDKTIIILPSIRNYNQLINRLVNRVYE